jgi:hypothetical protein
VDVETEMDADVAVFVDVTVVVLPDVVETV